MLECKDCCLYDTDACRYGKYALEHNMSLNCDDFIVEHNKAYKQGRTDAIEEVLSEIANWNASSSKKIPYAFARFLEKLKEQK